jgi:hypothetical protein
MSAERITLLTERIAAADAAKADFAFGNKTSKQSYAGHSVEYVAANVADIERQMRQDETELARLQGRPSPYRARRMTF